MVMPDTKRCHDLAMGLRMAYWAMHRRTDESLAKHGVTANQFVLLALLREDDGITQQDLVLRASSDPSTIRAMLVLLERKGLIARNRHARDGRALNVTLTPKGRQAYRQMWAITQSVRQRLSLGLDPRETISSVDLLARIADSMLSPTVSSLGQRKMSGKGGRIRTTFNEEIIISGSWECPQCGFTLNRNDLDLKRVKIGQNDGPFRCPNDGRLLEPETWKERCEKLAASCGQLLTEIQWLNDFCAVAPSPKLRLPQFARGNLRQLAQAGLEAPIKCKKCGRTNSGPAHKRRKSSLQSRVPLPPEQWICKSCGEPISVTRVKRP
jgi:DNA-binding MarR family transcriptional regulator